MQVSQLAKPRAIWLMVPAAVGDQALGDLVARLDSGKVVVDGGKSHFSDNVRRGSDIGSWRLDLTAHALQEFGGHAERSAA